MNTSLMNDRKPVLERAFELARTGGYARLAELRNALQAERYDDDMVQLSGASLIRSLQKTMKEARATNSSSTSDGARAGR